MPQQAITVTRSFGLKPLDEKRFSFDDVFGQALSISNTFIHAGLSLDKDLFSSKGHEAVKRFYDKVRAFPHVATRLNDTRFRERTCRCVAQSAYFAIREHVERMKLLSLIASNLLSGKGPAVMTARHFPSRFLVSAIRKQLLKSGTSPKTLSTPYLRNAFFQVRNIVRKAILKDHHIDIVKLLDSRPATLLGIDASVIVAELEASLPYLAKHLVKTFSSKLTRCFRRLSSKQCSGSANNQLNWLETLVLKIYHGNETGDSFTGNGILDNLFLRRWKRQRQEWRDHGWDAMKRWLESESKARMEKMMTPAIDMNRLVKDKLALVMSALTPERVLSCLFKPRKQRLPRCREQDISPANFSRWLELVVEKRMERAIIDATRKQVLPWALKSLEMIRDEPKQFLRRPCLHGRSIPFGQDDGQVYRLNVHRDENTGDLTGVHVTLSFYSSRRVVPQRKLHVSIVNALEQAGFSLEPVSFRLHRSGNVRFQRMLDDGFVPKKPTISLRHDGKLVLNVPFEITPVSPAPDSRKNNENPSDDGEKLEQLQDIETLIQEITSEWNETAEKTILSSIVGVDWNLLDENWIPPGKKRTKKRISTVVNRLRAVLQEPARACSVDLGIKTDITASIGNLHRLDNGTYSRSNVNHPDDARYFITQKHLYGNRHEWFLPFIDFTGLEGPGNVKRRLFHLMNDIRQLQSAIDAIKNDHPKDYRFHTNYRELHEIFVGKWYKLHCIHEELARQLATRLVAACEYHDVSLLRFENLSWSTHSRKQDVGYYLKSNQVHWFFSKVQEYATCLAHRAGIDVELVRARDTSQSCSRCGKRGHRQGKQFTCPHCGLQLDADLNAARNVAIAPTSPFGTFKAPRGLPPRATCYRGNSNSTSVVVEPRQIVQVT